MKTLVSMMLLAMTSLPLASAERTNIPLELSAFIGGFFGASYTVELKDGILHYSVRENGKETTTTITPTAEQWPSFRRALDELNIWNWRKHYKDRHVLDGTLWSVNIVYQGRKLASDGSNEYPRRKEFEQYLAAVRKLLGGKPFR